MDSKTQQKILFEVVCNVLASAAFAVVDPPDADNALDAGDVEEMLAAHLEFKGPFSGTMSIASSREFAVLAGENMLCMEDDVAALSISDHDLLKEILNMICGTFLPEFAGARLEFDIGAPEEMAYGEFERMSTRQDGGKTLVKLHVEGWPVEVLMRADPGSVAAVIEGAA